MNNLVPVEKFVKTPKQIEACEVLKSHRHSLLVGGARSTKTATIVRNMAVRAMMQPSRHLIVRSCFNHVKTSVWHDTFPKIMAGFFPGVQYKLNKTDYYVEIPCRKEHPGKTSQIWFGGTDSNERVEKILGNEYSTIFANEVSQMDYDTIIMLRTRLAENSGLTQRFYYDLNPVGKKHWSYLEFIKGEAPVEGGKSKIDSGHLFMNPIDNPFLSPEVMADYEALPLRAKQRFLLGMYLDDVEGALWNDIMIAKAQSKEPADLKRVVVAVDPAITHNENSDETGIVVCGLDMNNHGHIIADLSIRASTLTWAQRAVNAYHNYEANELVVETNQGGDLVEDALKNVDNNVKVVQVKASKGKFARAEPVSLLYEQNKVSHAPGLTELESQLTEYVPLNSKKSPDRLDALVWGLTRLMVKSKTRINLGSA